MNKVYMISQLMKKIKLGKEMMTQFPENRAEYLEETLTYSKALYLLLKESVLP